MLCGAAVLHWPLFPRLLSPNAVCHHFAQWNNTRLLADTVTKKCTRRTEANMQCKRQADSAKASALADAGHRLLLAGSIRRTLACLLPAFIHFAVAFYRQVEPLMPDSQLAK